MRFVPAHLREGDYDVAQRAFVLVHTAPLGVLALLSAALHYAWLRSPLHPVVVGSVVQGLACVALPPLLRASGSIRLTAAFNSTVTFAVFSWMVPQTGGLFSATAPLFLLVLLYVPYFLGFRWGAVVLFAYLAELGVLAFLHGKGAIAAAPVQPIEMLATLASVGGLTWLFTYLFNQGGVYARAAVKRQEAALVLAKERAEGAALARERLIAVVSHELRTPLNGVLGMSHLLRESGLTEQQRVLADTLEYGGNQLLAIVNDLLDYARFEAGGIQLERKPVDLRACAATVMALCRAKVANESVALRWSVSDDVPPWVWGDETRLTQVLVNLVGNAAKFTHLGEVELRIETNGAAGPGGVPLVLSVRDTGIGIDPNAMERVFEPFAQASPSIGDRYGGSGLGLTVTHSLTEAMGGTISVESTPSVGSVFTVELSLPPAPKPATEDASHELSPTALAERNPLRILVAEDDSINQRVVTMMLERLGYGADVVADGAQAVEAATSKRYDVILMDGQMPRLDGSAATAALRTSPAAGDPWIIALTAGSPESVAGSGVDDYLPKPLKQAALAGALTRAGMGRRATVAAGVDAPAVPVLDRERLRAVRELLDAASFAELVGAYLAQVDDGSRALEGAVRAGDMASVRFQAHRLKGAAAQLGLMELANRVGALEVSAPGAAGGHLPAYRAASVRAVEALRTELQSLPVLNE